jgi:hypothetical protein
MFRARLRARYREGVADNHLEDQPVGALRKTVADAEIYVNVADLEIGDGEEIMLLLAQGREIADLAEVGVIFETQRKILFEFMRQPRRRRECGRAVIAWGEIDDRIDDEFERRVPHADDRPQFRAKAR